MSKMTYSHLFYNFNILYYEFKKTVYYGSAYSVIASSPGQ